MARIALGGIQKLASNQACEEEGVDSKSDDLQEREARVKGEY